MSEKAKKVLLNNYVVHNSIKNYLREKIKILETIEGSSPNIEAYEAALTLIDFEE